MVNGLPGKMATEVARLISRSNGFVLVDHCLTGEEIKEKSLRVDDKMVELVRPLQRGGLVDLTKENKQWPFLAVDFSHPNAVNDNAGFYCENKLPFVMGTTGGNRDLLVETVRRSEICAVIAPNMASQIVALQAMIEYGAKNFPGSFEGFKLRIVESHQKGKVDTSGTAKAMVKQFNSLGMQFDVKDIEMVREPHAQLLRMGVSEKHLDGHGYHTYDFVLPDGSIAFSITHNVNGRLPYAVGTLKALSFLSQKVNEGVKGKVFTMIDVLKG